MVEAFLRDHFSQHMEMALHNTLYLFEHMAPQEKLTYLKQRMEAYKINK